MQIEMNLNNLQVSMLTNMVRRNMVEMIEVMDEIPGAIKDTSIAFILEKAEILSELAQNYNRDGYRDISSQDSVGAEMAAEVADAIQPILPMMGDYQRNIYNEIMANFAVSKEQK
jgi:hypothetical protein